MKKLFIALIPFFMLASCGDGDSVSLIPLEDVSEHVEKNNDSSSSTSSTSSSVQYENLKKSSSSEASLENRKQSSCSAGKSSSSKTGDSTQTSSSEDSLDLEKTSSSSILEESSSSYLEIVVIDPSSVVFDSIIDSRDGQIYKTVTIGKQKWMAQNLNYDYNEIPYASFCYGDDMENCSVHGRMYKWSAAMDSAGVFSVMGKNCGDKNSCKPSGFVRGVCPEGWHLPSEEEWNVLLNAVGGGYDDPSFSVLKSGSWFGKQGKNDYGFALLPSGEHGMTVGGYYNFGSETVLWTSSQGEEDFALGIWITPNVLSFTNFSKRKISYVRCVEDSVKMDDAQNPVSSFSGYSLSSSSVSVVYGSLVDARDNQSYKTIVIGKQTWMAENLNYVFNEPSEDWDSLSFCVYNVVDSCSKYGRLYMWDAAKQACPEGWHLPSNEEWNVLWSAVGGVECASEKLRSRNGWYHGGNGSDAYGFTVIPAGARNGSGGYSTFGKEGVFWSATEDKASGNIWRWEFISDTDQVYSYQTLKKVALSIRCLKD